MNITTARLPDPSGKGESQTCRLCCNIGSTKRPERRRNTNRQEVTKLSNNTRMLLDQFFAQQKSEQVTPLSDDKAFELFASEQVLKDSDLSTEELSSGIVGGGNDGGIDGVYTFVGDQLINDDSDIFDSDFSTSKISQGIALTLRLIQAKAVNSFAETPIDLVASSTARLLDLGQTEEHLQTLYSPPLVERFSLFRRALQLLAIRHPTTRIEFSYATRGDTDTMNSKVQQKAKDLEMDFSKTITGATGVVSFFGADELWISASAVPNYTLQLTYRENATSGTSHVALVSLRNYVAFLSDSDGNLNRHIFDWNVRDYQGNIEINKEIRFSLEDEQAPDFWWLNNGVTIVCSKASIQGKTYTLDDVQIVNGLQTSYTTFHALSAAQKEHPVFERTLLVRILQTEDPATRDRVIRATNRQTSVPEASLRATDDTQRRIEAFFASNDLYYDRRKNYYRNNGRPKDRIVGIPLLAQTVMAVGLSRPDDSRARPSSLLKSDQTYQTIFSSDIPLEIYLWAANAQREVDAFLQTPEAGVSTPERTNLRFHLAMLAATKLLGTRVYSPKQLNKIAVDARTLHEADLPACLATLRETMQKLIDETDESPDKIAKGRRFVEEILDTAGFN